MKIFTGRAVALVFMTASVMGIVYVATTFDFSVDFKAPLSIASPKRQTDSVAPMAVLESTQPIVRTYAPDTGWTRTWVLGSDTTTDMFIEPRHVAVSGDVVAILDDGTREVRAFDVLTGATRFALLPRGQGPGEFKRPSMMVSTPTGFAVLDGENARLTAYNREGKLEWDVVLADIAAVGGLCIRSGPSISVYHQRAIDNIVDYDTTGRRTAVRTVAWPDTKELKAGFAFSSFVSNAGTGGACVVAPIFGAQWAVIEKSGPIRSSGYKEPGATPIITIQEQVLGRSGTQIAIQTNSSSDSPHAARGALIIGDTAIIAAAHTKQFRYRILDYHKLGTGEYLYSRLLPMVFNSLAIGPDGTFYGTMIGESRQVLVAMRPGKN